MGDTLIALGLVNGVEMFRAIREQGRDRMVDLFAWNRGKLLLYFGHSQPVVEFPLELELAPLMLAGLEAAQPNDAPMHAFRAQLDATIGPASTSTSRPRLRAMLWPPLVTKVLEAAAEPKPLREAPRPRHPRRLRHRRRRPPRPPNPLSGQPPHVVVTR